MRSLGIILCNLSAALSFSPVAVVIPREGKIQRIICTSTPSSMTSTFIMNAVSGGDFFDEISDTFPGANNNGASENEGPSHMTYNEWINAGQNWGPGDSVDMTKEEFEESGFNYKDMSNQEMEQWMDDTATKEWLEEENANTKFPKGEWMLEEDQNWKPDNIVVDPRFCSITLIGRVGNDPMPRYFDDGKVVLNLSLAVKRCYHPVARRILKIQSSEEGTDWHQLEIWGRNAEYAAKYVDKGMRIAVGGSLKISRWVDKETNMRKERLRIAVDNLEILETRAESDMRRDMRRQTRRRPSFAMDDDEDDGLSSAGTGGFFD